MNDIEQEHLVERELHAFKQSLRRDRHEACYEVQRVLDFIRAHLFDESLNVDVILARCNIRSHGFSGRFKHQMKAAGRGRITMRRYIEQARLTGAQQLLQYDDLDLYLIASSVGYKHYETFCRAFKRFFGTSPSQYRQRRPVRASEELLRSAPLPANVP